MSRQFYYTRQTCTMLEQAIRAKWPDIRGLKVRLDPERIDIEVRFEDDRFTPRQIEEFISSLPKYVK